MLHNTAQTCCMHDIYVHYVHLFIFPNLVGALSNRCWVVLIRRPNYPEYPDRSAVRVYLNATSTGDSLWSVGGWARLPVAG